MIIKTQRPVINSEDYDSNFEETSSARGRRKRKTKRRAFKSRSRTAPMLAKKMRGKRSVGMGTAWKAGYSPKSSFDQSLVGDNSDLSEIVELGDSGFEGQDQNWAHELDDPMSFYDGTYDYLDDDEDDDEFSEAGGFKKFLAKRKSGAGARKKKRQQNQMGRKTKRATRKAKRLKNKAEKGNILQQFAAKFKAKVAQIKGKRAAKLAAKNGTPPLQVSSKSTPEAVVFNRPLPIVTPNATTILGTSTTPPAPKTKAETNIAYRAWANSTPELKVKFGANSPYSLDATGSPNSYFDRSYKAGEAQFKASTINGGLNTTNAEVVKIGNDGTITPTTPSEPVIKVGTTNVATADVPTGKIAVVDENGNAVTEHAENEVVIATDTDGKEKAFIKNDTNNSKKINLSQWSTLKKVLIFGVVPAVVIAAVIVAVKMSKVSKGRISKVNKVKK